MLALAALLALTACAGQGFNQRMAGGYSAVSFSRDAAGALLDAGEIAPAEAQNVQDQANHFRAALDLTRGIAWQGELETAEAKLAATLAGIDGLRDYLRRLQSEHAKSEALP